MNLLLTMFNNDNNHDHYNNDDDVDDHDADADDYKKYAGFYAVHILEIQKLTHTTT